MTTIRPKHTCQGGRPIPEKWSVAALTILVAIASTVGCSRAHYRRQADTEVNCIIDNKAIAVGSAPGEFRINVDPRSRMYDPNNPDCPPMPPDDPVSHQLMNCVDCKPNAPCYQHAPKTPYVDNPRWQDELPRDADGNVVLDLTGAVQLALLESPAYQTQLENLYLSGLDVTFERFRFDSQFFGGTSVFFTADGRRRSGTGNSSSLLEVQPSRAGNRLRAEKFTATGGELVVGFANSLMWQFAGPDDYSSRSLLDFSMVQPLLRFGGRQRVMERLTISERALLANVRQMEHYRRGFYLNVVTGRDAGPGPNRRGGFFGSGFEGFSGIGGGGFGGVGNLGGGNQNQNAGFTGGAGAQQAGGYLGLLQSAQIIRNQFTNIAGLGDSVDQLQAAYEAGRLDRFQVDLARQALYNAQSQLLNSQAQYETALDNFKLQYGLTPSLNLKISDPMLDHFNLLDPELAEVQLKVTGTLTTLRDRAAKDAGAPAPPGPNLPDLPSETIIDGDITNGPAEIATLLAEVTELKALSQQRFAAAEDDYRKLEQALPARRNALARFAKQEEVDRVDMDPELFSSERLDERVQAIHNDLDSLGKRFASAWARIDDIVKVPTLPATGHQAKLISALTELSGELLELSLLQARARLEAVTFDPVDLTSEEGFCIASRHRRDWMNARAALVDSWRLIGFNANALQSDLNLVFSGDLGNVGDNPFRFRDTNGRLRVGLEFDAPLTRLAERNAYRQSLVEYQQARRTYYRFRDGVHQQIRNSLRQLNVDQSNFELRRAAVRVAITQVDLTRLRLSEPARPVQASAPGQPTQPGGEGQFGDTVARDLVNALIDLLNVQNDFLSVWVDHEVQRLNLDFVLGTMELDNSGLRIEHDQPLRTFLTNLPNTVPCELPDACQGVASGAGETSSEEKLQQPRSVEPLPTPPQEPEIIPASPELPPPMPAPGEGSQSQPLPPSQRKNGGVVHASAMMPTERSPASLAMPIGTTQVPTPVRLPTVVGK